MDIFITERPLHYSKFDKIQGTEPRWIGTGFAEVPFLRQMKLVPSTGSGTYMGFAKASAEQLLLAIAAYFIVLLIQLLLFLETFWRSC